MSSRTAGVYPSPIDMADQLGRVNFLRSEPANATQSSSRFFVNDLNRNLYILDKTTRTVTPYINFEEVFPKFENAYPGLGRASITFTFDPDYANNGKFYTGHTEDPNRSGSAVPIKDELAGTRSDWLHHDQFGRPACRHGRPARGYRGVDGHQPE